jgi:F0F1-type ATP synthase assembly protein I
MSERCRVSIMGKDGSLGKATKMQKKEIAACKAKKRKTTFNKVKNTVSKVATKGYQQSANFLSEQVSKLKK